MRTEDALEWDIGFRRNYYSHVYVGFSVQRGPVQRLAHRSELTAVKKNHLTDYPSILIEIFPSFQNVGYLWSEIYTRNGFPSAMLAC